MEEFNGGKHFERHNLLDCQLKRRHVRCVCECTNEVQSNTRLQWHQGDAKSSCGEQEQPHDKTCEDQPNNYELML